MVPLTAEDDEGDGRKHGLKKVGNKYVFSIKKLSSEDAGLYSIDVEGVNVFSTDFKGELQNSLQLFMLITTSSRLGKILIIIDNYMNIVFYFDAWESRLKLWKIKRCLIFFFILYAKCIQYALCIAFSPLKYHIILNVNVN